MTEMHDSGKRQAFATGAVRDTAEGKPLMRLISPVLWERVGYHWRKRGTSGGKELLATPRNMGDFMVHMGLYGKGYGRYGDVVGEGGVDYLMMAFLDVASVMGDLGLALERLGAWLSKGAEKYKERNWEQGIPVGRSLDSLMRHLGKWLRGMTEEDHLAAMLCNIMFMMHTEAMCFVGVLPKELMDLPQYLTAANKGGANNE